jgi:hypothetical protein
MTQDDGQRTDDQTKAVKPGLLWWFKQILLTGFAIFFVYFGICLLLGAYQLNDPFSFIMTFFGASLMTLISVVMVLGFVLRMIGMIRPGRSVDAQEGQKTGP